MDAAEGIDLQTGDGAEAGAGGEIAGDVGVAEGEAIAGDGVDASVGGDATQTTVASVGDEEVALGVEGEFAGAGQLGAGGSATVATEAFAIVAGDAGGNVGVEIDTEDAMVARLRKEEATGGIDSKAGGIGQAGADGAEDALGSEDAEAGSFGDVDVAIGMDDEAGGGVEGGFCGWAVVAFGEANGVGGAGEARDLIVGVDLEQEVGARVEQQDRAVGGGGDAAGVEELDAGVLRPLAGEDLGAARLETVELEAGGGRNDEAVAGGLEHGAGLVDGDLEGLFADSGTDATVAEDGLHAVLFEAVAEEAVGARLGDEECSGVAIEVEGTGLLDVDGAGTGEGGGGGSTGAGADEGFDVEGGVNATDAAVAGIGNVEVAVGILYETGGAGEGGIDGFLVVAREGGLAGAGDGFEVAVGGEAAEDVEAGLGEGESAFVVIDHGTEVAEAGLESFAVAIAGTAEATAEAGQRATAKAGPGKALGGGAGAGAGDVDDGFVRADFADHAELVVEVEELLLGSEEKERGTVGCGVGLNEAFGVDAADAVGSGFGNVDVAFGVFGDAVGEVEDGFAGRTTVAEVGGGEESLDAVRSRIAHDDLREEKQKENWHKAPTSA